MKLPLIWGQGLLFAFSAWDGPSFFGDPAGYLCGDRVGIRFFTKTKRELVLTGFEKQKPVFEIVTGDLIRARIASGEAVEVVFARRDLIVGRIAGTVRPFVFVEGDSVQSARGGAVIHDTGDGEITALAVREDRFALAFGAEADRAAKLAEEGLGLDPEEEAETKIAFYRAAPAAADEELAAKCLSVMKTQLCSPEGGFLHTWSTPDRLPHRHLFLWDSVFHAIGFRHLDGSLAEDLILAVLDRQREDGFISHYASPYKASSITQPPVIAWGAWRVFEKTGDEGFLRAVFGANARFLKWCRDRRREVPEEELYTWQTDEKALCRCAESGMDNSPRFDTPHRLQAIDFTSFMANETRFMQKIAALLGKDGDARFYEEWNRQIARDLRQKLYSPADGFYYDYDLDAGRLHKIRSVASFLPLFAGAASSEEAEALVAALCDPKDFGTPFPVPSVSKRDPTYGSDMWRGPVWINTNYMIAEGLEAYGFDALAGEIREKTVRVLGDYYRKTGVLFEFYDSENHRAPWELNRKGPPHAPYDPAIGHQAVRDFGWTTTLLYDLLCKGGSLRGEAEPV